MSHRWSFFVRLNWNNAHKWLSLVPGTWNMAVNITIYSDSEITPPLKFPPVFSWLIQTFHMSSGTMICFRFCFSDSRYHITSNSKQIKLQLELRRVFNFLKANHSVICYFQPHLRRKTYAIEHNIIDILLWLPARSQSCQSWSGTSARRLSRDITQGKSFNILSAAVDRRHFSLVSLFITSFHLFLRSFYLCLLIATF